MAEDFFIENPRDKTYHFLKTKSRKLDLLRYEYILGEANAKDVLNELANYQLEDGGFGKGLISGMVYQGSSAYASLQALRIIDEIKIPQTELLINLFNFLKNDYKNDYQGWYNYPKGNGQYEQLTWLSGKLNHTWPTLNVELISYFEKYRIDFSEFNSLVNKALTYLRDTEVKQFTTRDVISYLRFYDYTTHENRKQISEKLIKIALYQIGHYADEWVEQSNLPVLYARHRDALLYPLLHNEVELSLGYLLEVVDEVNGVWFPNWPTISDENFDWARAKDAEAGNLTVMYTSFLKEFGFIG